MKGRIHIIRSLPSAEPCIHRGCILPCNMAVRPVGSLVGCWFTVEPTPPCRVTSAIRLHGAYSDLCRCTPPCRLDDQLGRLPPHFNRMSCATMSYLHCFVGLCTTVAAVAVPKFLVDMGSPQMGSGSYCAAGERHVETLALPTPTSQQQIPDLPLALAAIF